MTGDDDAVRGPGRGRGAPGPRARPPPPPARSCRTTWGRRAPWGGRSPTTSTTRGRSRAPRGRGSPRSPTRRISRASGWSHRGWAPRSGSARRCSPAVAAGLRREVRGVGPARLLVVAEAIAGDEIRELRWLAIHVLGWIVAADPERACSSSAAPPVRRMTGSRSTGWPTRRPRDPAESYRWAELEHSSTAAAAGSAGSSAPPSPRSPRRPPFRAYRAGYRSGPLSRRPAVGDAELDVQKALSWALRELAKGDPVPVAAFCLAQAHDACGGPLTATGPGCSATR